MAQFIPTLSDILLSSVKPTDGELTLLRFLHDCLDDSFEIYYHPYLNGDKPDIIVLRKGVGALIVEVCELHPNNFTIDEDLNWIDVMPYAPENNSIFKSPIDKVYHFKENLFDLHIDRLLELKIQDFGTFNIVKGLVYFPYLSHEEIVSKIETSLNKNDKQKRRLAYEVGLMGSDNINSEYLNSILRKLNLITPSLYFTDEIYSNFKRLLSPTVHMLTDGHPIDYDKKQRDIINRSAQSMRIKGVFGSGKTTTLAARAVSIYKRLCKTKKHPKILILTYNLTLKNFIKDKLMAVQQEFVEQDFIIISYHQFINAELNNLGIEVKIRNKDSKISVSDYLGTSFYDNETLFAKHKDRIRPYDAVLIDEIQDYKRSWMNIVKDNFLIEGGDYALFGDVKQNIYRNPTEKKDVVTNHIGGVFQLNQCHRSDSKIQDLALAFQSLRFCEKYELDEIDKIDSDSKKEGYVEYRYIPSNFTVPQLYEIVRTEIISKHNQVAPNDITILGNSLNLLREFDNYYRTLTRERTKTMFETSELMYRVGLNKKDLYGTLWHDDLYKLLLRWNSESLKCLSKHSQQIKIRNFISIILSKWELYNKYPQQLQAYMESQCQSLHVPFQFVNEIMKKYTAEIDSFKSQISYDPYDKIRRNKKMNFIMDCGLLKLSTIHSFKGWESRAVFLIVENGLNPFESDELIYTGITRATERLTIINFGNEGYDKILKPLTDKVNGIINSD